MCAIVCVLLLWLCEDVDAQCRSPVAVVDTGDQACGLAPRLDVALELHAAAALGNPCLQSGDARSCNSPGLPMLGAQVLAELRLWRRVAIGAVLAYDHRVGGKTFGSGSRRSEYSSYLWRPMLELRWYSHGVAAGGPFVTLRAGAAWITDSVFPQADIEGPSAVTQAAPVIGLGFGGAFVTYDGIGTTLAMQAFVAPFPKRGAELGRGFGRAYGYGTLIFLGLTVGLMLGTGL
jgi:hypothetical protein